MKKCGQRSGFTIVELLIVIIIGAVLATLIALAYGNAQAQANDMKIRDAANKFAEAIQLMETRTGKFPPGGVLSSAAATPANGCSDGAGGWQAPAFGGVTCTIGDAAVAMGFLPLSLFTSLPHNIQYAPSTTYKNVFRTERCGTINYLLYTLEQPTPDETAVYNTVSATCVAVADAKTNNNMQALINLSDY